jgi:antagonist of KipI
MALEILDVSGLATLQDSGRTGWRQFGVPACGPMDVFAFCAANALVGNPAGWAVIEVGLGDAVIQAKQDCVIAVAGAGYRLSIYIWEFPLWSSYFVRAGWRVHLSKTNGGLWAYMAVAGGFRSEPVLGSRSTYLRGGFGGLEGRPLQAGDILRTGPLPRLSPELAARTLPEEARPKYSDHPTIDVIMGPQTDFFADADVESFLSGEYSISLTSDRMGYRLEGHPLRRRDETELISEGLSFGAIQVPSGGQPIVMMADCPTTGGYPKIGTVASAHLPVLAQCAPGKSGIRFRETTVERSQKSYRALMHGLQGIIESE